MEVLKEIAKPIIRAAGNAFASKVGEKIKEWLDGDDKRRREQLANEKARADREHRWRMQSERALANERAKSQRLALIIKLAIFIGILYGIYHYFEFAFLESIYEGIKWLFVTIYDGLKWLFVNIYDGIKWLFVNIYDGIKWLVIKIYDGVVWILVSIYDGIKWVIVGIYDFIVGLFS